MRVLPRRVKAVRGRPVDGMDGPGEGDRIGGDVDRPLNVDVDLGEQRDPAPGTRRGAVTMPATASAGDGALPGARPPAPRPPILRPPVGYYGCRGGCCYMPQTSVFTLVRGAIRQATVSSEECRGRLVAASPASNLKTCPAPTGEFSAENPPSADTNGELGTSAQSRSTNRTIPSTPAATILRKR